MNIWHSIPATDLIGHEERTNCVCGPSISFVNVTGEQDILAAHHALLATHDQDRNAA